MSNKTISVYAEAIKRQQAEQTHPAPIPTLTQLNGRQQQHRATDLEQTPEEKPVVQPTTQENPSFRENADQAESISSYQTSYPASKPASVLAHYPASSVEFLRKAVRFSGKE